MKEHPEQVPAWAQEIHPWDVVALSRHIIWGWPMGEAVGDLAGGRREAHAARLSRLERDAHRPQPHGDEGPDRRHRPARELVRRVPLLRGPDLRPRRAFNVSGVSILGQPIPSLGHSRYCSVAMTTGGPDTSDIYEEEVNPDDPRSVPLRRPVAQDDGAHRSRSASRRATR